MYLATEVWPTSMPSLRSSPWMRGAPQSGLARLIFRISRRISGRDAWPAGTPTRFPAPKGAEACAMPSDNCFRLYDSERVQNTRRDPIQADEDHTIEVAEDRAPR